MTDLNDDLNFDIKLENNDAIKQEKLSSTSLKKSSTKPEVLSAYSQ